MLRRLVVENYALIEHLEIEFDSSLNGTMDDGDVEDWLDDIKARRRPLILFIISTIVLLVLGGFLP